MRASRQIVLVFAALLAFTAIVTGPAVRTAAAADSQPPGIDPATGGPVGAPAGCCCFPKLHPTDTEKFDCKAGLTEFDCKVECSSLKDGRLPSGCKWTTGACPR